MVNLGVRVRHMSPEALQSSLCFEEIESMNASQCAVEYA